MITNYISSAVIIERIHNNYNIQSEDFVSRISSWIFSALKQIGVKQAYVVNIIHGEFTDGKFGLPDYVHSIYDVAVNGQPIDYDYSNQSRNHIKLGETTTPIISFDGSKFQYINNPYVPTDMIINNISDNDFSSVFGDRTIGKNTNNRICDLSYVRYTIKNGWIHLINIDKGSIAVSCSQIPYVWDNNLDILFPVIPDNEELIECITQYCLGLILMRGYKHPVLSLTVNNPFVNPMMAYKNGMLAARNSCNKLSPSAKDTLKKITGTNFI